MAAGVPFTLRNLRVQIQTNQRLPENLSGKNGSIEREPVQLQTQPPTKPTECPTSVAKKQTKLFDQPPTAREPVARNNRPNPFVDHSGPSLESASPSTQVRHFQTDIDPEGDRGRSSLQPSSSPKGTLELLQPEKNLLKPPKPRRRKKLRQEHVQQFQVRDGILFRFSQTTSLGAPNHRGTWWCKCLLADWWAGGAFETPFSVFPSRGLRQLEDTHTHTHIFSILMHPEILRGRRN